MKLIPTLILLAFFIFRYGFTLIKGKRKSGKVARSISLGKKFIEIIIFILMPALILLELIDMQTNTYLYNIGILVSIFGLLLMILTRLNRSTDWGFMGGIPGNDLFTNGPYRFTRHPYYIGAILVGTGLYLQLNYFFVILIIPVMIFIMYVIKKEEDFLEKEFGTKYTEYKKKVGIFPWLY